MVNDTRIDIRKLSEMLPRTMEYYLKRGIEKENLRIQMDGKLAQTPHPHVFGAALTNPRITTDFSESMLEMITPPEGMLEEVFSQLKRVNSFIQRNLSDELLWPSSMPCDLSEQNIALADYGTTNIAKLKKIYRQGLSHRYGLMMQMISGIHYNFSLTPSFMDFLKRYENSKEAIETFSNQKYMGMVRNIYRHAWLLVYLFGASPACSASSNTSSLPYLSTKKDGTVYSEYATSLRLSDMGYHNKYFNCLNISYNSAQEYAHSLLEATQNPCSAFYSFSKEPYQQLNDSVLQIENEYYGFARPKQTINSGERPAHALLRRGVAYVELRILDLNPLQPHGMSREQMAFLDLFLLYCALTPSPLFRDNELKLCNENIKRVAVRGRDPSLKIFSTSSNLEQPFESFAKALLDDISQLNALFSNELYAKSIANQAAKINDVELLDSSKIAGAIIGGNMSFQEYHLRIAKHNKEHNGNLESADEEQRAIAQQSLECLQKIQQRQEIDFDDYLKDYFTDKPI